MSQAIADVWDSGGRRFVTVEDAGDDAYFVQYVDGQLNVSWLLDSEPEIEFSAVGAELPDGAFVLSWAPQGTLQIAVGDLLLEDVADLMELLLDEILEVDDAVIRVEFDR